MPPKNTAPKKRIGLKKGLLLLLVVILGVAWYNRHGIYDEIRLANYTPPADVQVLAEHDELTKPAKRVFYVNHPAIEDKSAFASSCPLGGKETAVLGCYVPNQQGIYVLRVSDMRLNGIEEVTAAHEMLHAAYDRLSAKDRQQVDGWLLDYYKHGLTDPNIISQMDSYKKTEPNDLVNEMHSIFGTEVRSLPNNLESYYKRYFVDRQKITGYYSAYQAEFTSRTNQIKHDDTQLAALKQQIKTDETDLKSKKAQLDSRQNQLNAARQSGNIPAYNAGVPAYNALVDTYNAEVKAVKALVDQYNVLVTARNALVLEEQQLVQDITSQVVPISSQ